MWFLTWRAEESLVVNNKDNRVFKSRNGRDSIFVLRTSNFRGATIYQLIAPQQKHSIV